jgi:hypothetical protein
MKRSFCLTTGIALSSLLLTFNSCQKESISPEKNLVLDIESRANKKKKPFKGTFDTYYNFVPDVANGWSPPNPAPAWYPGGGNGNLTHMGNCQTFFNQYATFGPAGLQSAAAPVNMFFAAQLSASGFTVPGNVSTIFFNGHGQSVWSLAEGASTTTPVSPTRVEFTASHSIIGGTGRFNCASGSFVLKGFFNPQDNQDAGFEVDGWIKY